MRPPPPVSPAARRVEVLLWTVQFLLAALFLFGGGTKLVLPLAALTAQSTLPGAFLRLVGVLEVLGALGLVLPGRFGLRRELTPLAAAGLVLIMCGAVGATLGSPQGAAAPAMALIPAAVGALAAVVAYGRARALLRRPVVAAADGRPAAWVPALPPVGLAPLGARRPA